MEHLRSLRVWRLVVAALGVGLAVPILAAAMLAMVTPLTSSGAVYLLAAALVAAGLLSAPWWRRFWLVMLLAGVALALAIAGTRLSLAGQQSAAPVRMVTLPAGSGPRWLSHLVDEQDLLLFGEALMRRMGGVSRREHAGLVPALTAGYAELRTVQTSFSSPVMSTYLFWQWPRAFDAVVVEPEGQTEPEAAIVFLHGFAGNVSLQCWEIAQAARARGMLTVCPSTGWIGDWWRRGGAATLRATLAYVRGRGVEHIYAGGFSNGGIGLSELAGEVEAEDGVRGLFFIAGVTNGDEIAATGLPVLVIQGALDERMTAPAARHAAEAIGEAAEYVELEADHFLIVKEAEAVAAALGGWLEEVEGAVD